MKQFMIWAQKFKFLLGKLVKLVKMPKTNFYSNVLSATKNSNFFLK